MERNGTHCQTRPNWPNPVDPTKKLTCKYGQEIHAEQTEWIRTAAKLTLTGVITKEYRTQMNPVAARAVGRGGTHHKCPDDHMETERRRYMRIHEPSPRKLHGLLNAPKF